MEEWREQIPLRVLMTTDTVGGVWSYCMELCKALLPFNIHFDLVTTGAPLQLTQKEEAEQLENVCVHETDFLLEWMENPWESIDASGNWLLKLEQDLQPDLIHLNSYAYGALAWIAPVLMVAHSDVWSWWHAVKGEQPPKEWNEYYHRVRNGLIGPGYLIAPSKAMLNAVQSIYQIDTPASVIYNGRNGDDFYATKKEPYVFSMGRLWDESKNVQLLMEAAPHINYSIKIAGDNTFENNTTSTTGANISYLGKLTQREVAEQLAAASIYVLPAKYEPFGLSVLEAALSGCALVLGNIDSLKEIWSDSAIYVETADAGALADAVNYLMQNDAVRTQYAQKAKAQAEKYSTTTFAENYNRIYYQLLQQKTIKISNSLHQTFSNTHS